MSKPAGNLGILLLLTTLGVGVRPASAQSPASAPAPQAPIAPVAAPVPPAPPLLIRPPMLRGMDALAYRAKVRAGDEAYRTERWADAARLLGEAAAAYPYDGRIWSRLGVAFYRSESFAAAASAFAQAHRFGLSSYPERNAANAARSYASAGRAAEAVEWIKIALHERYLQPDQLLAEAAFEPIRSSPEFQSLLASRAVGPAGNRTEQWQRDLDHFVNEVTRVKLEPRSGGAESEKFLAAAAALRPRLGSLSDAQALLEMQKLISIFGQGHNGGAFRFIAQKLGGSEFKQLPLTFYAFPSGYFIVGADEPHRALIGAKVERVGKMTPDQILTQSADFSPRDNDMAIVWSGVSTLGQTTLLHAMGATDSADRAELQLRLPNGRWRAITLEGVAIRPNPKLAAPAGSPAQAPLYLRRVGESYWFEDIRPAVTYFQFNQVTPTNAGFDLQPNGHLTPRTGGETINAFAERLGKHLTDSGSKTLIVDLRHNNGGNTYVYGELLRTLIGFDLRPNTQIYVITGRNTFSAATNFVIDVDRMTDALFAGEPMSGSAIQPGDSMDVMLPFSGARFMVSTIDWALQSPWDTRIWVAPDLPVVLTAEDYFANRDPILEVILADVARTTG